MINIVNPDDISQSTMFLGSVQILSCKKLLGKTHPNHMRDFDWYRNQLPRTAIMLCILLYIHHVLKKE